MTTQTTVTLSEKLNTVTEALNEALALAPDTAGLPLKRDDKAVNAALTEVYENDYRKFYFAAYAIVKNSEIARDLVHDAFVKSKSRAAQFQGGSRLSTYIFRITVNNALDHVRSGKHKASVNGGAKEASKCEADWQPHDIVPKSFPSPLRALLTKEKFEGVQSVMDKMSPKKLAVLRRYALEGEKLKDIAELEGIKLGTALSRLNAARLDLRAAGL